MNHKVIKTESDYNDAVKRVYELIHSEADPIEADSPKGEELELLSLLIERYEDEMFPVTAPDYITAIKFRMEQMSLLQKDIAPLFGGETRVSEVLNGKRRLTIKMIVMLNRYLGIPLESLIGNKRDYILDSSREKKLMEVPVIRDFLTKYNKVVI